MIGAVVTEQDRCGRELMVAAPIRKFGTTSLRGEERLCAYATLPERIEVPHRRSRICLPGIGLQNRNPCASLIWTSLRISRN
jgi:hypothetical protein